MLWNKIRYTMFFQCFSSSTPKPSADMYHRVRKQYNAAREARKKAPVQRVDDRVLADVATALVKHVLEGVEFFAKQGARNMCVYHDEIVNAYGCTLSLSEWEALVQKKGTSISRQLQPFKVTFAENGYAFIEVAWA